MSSSYYKLYLTCLLLLFSNYLFADNLTLPPATSCSLNVTQEQRAVLLSHCLDAAKAGDQEAQYQLGLYYSEGKLTATDYPQAIKWLKKASMQAHVDAQVKLGYMYFKGQGVAINNLQAYLIFKVASINGSDEAMDQADEVAMQMTPQELQQANIILGKTFRSYLKSIRTQP